jgi:hypothetical protein
MEAAVHAARLYIHEMPSSNCALTKLDFRNAFNTIRRDCMLEAVIAPSQKLTLSFMLHTQPHLRCTTGQILSILKKVFNREIPSDLYYFA